MSNFLEVEGRREKKDGMDGTAGINPLMHACIANIAARMTAIAAYMLIRAGNPA